MAAASSAAGAELTSAQKQLYDRQIGALGMAAMQKLVQQSVLVVGLRGLGVEIAKNVILAGPKSVTVADAGQVDVGDLSAQFYLSEGAVGRDRALASIEQLRELNPYVNVQPHTGPLTAEFVREFTAVVMTCSTPEEKVRVNEFCRIQSPPIKFIAAEVHGLFGTVFVDFGPDGHVVTDTDGEKPRVAWVASVAQSSPAVVTLLEDFPFAFEVGDWVTVTEVPGMVELNGRPPVRVTKVTKFTVELDLDSTGFSACTGSGGSVTQAKIPVAVSHRSLLDVSAAPGAFLEADFGKFGRPAQLHVAFNALHAFQTAHMGALPELNCVAHADEVVALARAANAAAAEPLELDEQIVRLLAYHARSELSPMASIFGGIVAQEVVKATGKYMPLSQVFYFDALETLGEAAERYDPTSADYKLDGSRYDGQIAVFGRAMQERLGALRYFIVGAGALGCEFLKGFAMMGIGCGPNGRVAITDMDRIETSNLNRQFLFRNWNVGQAKSVTAAAAIRVMNPALNVSPIEMRVGGDTEEFFNDAFWYELDGVCNALDNVKARLYVDSRCVQYKKPLLESGTLGTKGSVQVVVPFVTESYGSSPDPPEKETPQCTLHNFPYLIDHCIQLAREEFETAFAKAAVDVVQWLARGDEHLATAKHPHEQRLMLESIHEVLTALPTVDMAACVAWARNKFESLYNHRIRQILTLLPPDKRDESGALFWSGTKRIPAPIEFSLDEPMHMQFILAAANVRAFMFRLAPVTDLAALREMVARVAVIPFPASGLANLKIQTKEGEKIDPAADDDHARIAELKRTMPRGDAARVQSIEFEKDDDTNFHIDYVTAASNLRARNYRIDELDRLRVKMIAGRIIPALATTTATTTGFVLLELVKLVSGPHKLERFRNAFFNLALPLFALSEPVAPKQLTTPGPKGEIYVPSPHTLWDRFELEGDVTLQQLMDWFTERHALEVTMVSLGESLLFASFMPAHRARVNTKISELFVSVCKGVITPSMRQLTLVVGCENADGAEVDVPVTYVKFK